MLNLQQICLFGQIQTSETGGRLYSDTIPYGVCSLVILSFNFFMASTHNQYYLQNLLAWQA